MAYNVRYERKSGYYEAGSTAKALPKEDPEIKRESEQEYLRNARLKVEQKAKVKRQERREFSLLQITVLAAALFTLTALLSIYLFTLSENHDARAALDSLKKQYEELKEENILLENEEDSRIDYDAVYKCATEELGMCIPEKQQVIYYARAEGEYVTAGVEIPNE